MHSHLEAQRERCGLSQFSQHRCWPPLMPWVQLGMWQRREVPLSLLCEDPEPMRQCSGCRLVPQSRCGSHHVSAFAVPSTNRLLPTPGRHSDSELVCAGSIYVDQTTPIENELERIEQLHPIIRPCPDDTSDDVASQPLSLILDLSRGSGVMIGDVENSQRMKEARLCHYLF